MQLENSSLISVHLNKMIETKIPVQMHFKNISWHGFSGTNIRFYPDGTATNGHLLLIGQSEKIYRIKERLKQED